MNKTALITLWIDPAEHQIVKYTFDNVWLDFLPGGLAGEGRRHPGIDDHGPAVSGRVAAARASTSTRASRWRTARSRRGYERKFAEYRLAEVATKMRVPKKDDEELERPDDHGPFVAERRPGLKARAQIDRIASPRSM